MTAERYGWCSWCHKRTRHDLATGHMLTRNDYRCAACGNFTVICRCPGCENMAILRPGEPTDDASFFDRLIEQWGHEFCGEHDGSIPDFEQLDKRLDDLADYQAIYKRRCHNLRQTGAVAGGMILGTAVFGPFVYLAAPGIASALGATGVLGAASTGTAISSLSGAALTSASLAAIGPGGMAGGMAFLTATGSALAGTQGAVISNNYLGQDKSFRITKVREGSGPALIFINGFLSQKKQDASDWLEGTQEKFPKNPCYYVTWESSSLYKLGSLLGQGVANSIFKRYIIKLMKQGSLTFADNLNPMNWASFTAKLLANPWHTSMVKAGNTGISLATLLARTNNKDGFILMGHSLGARVIYYMLESLCTRKGSDIIVDAYLMGGAVGKDDSEAWDRVSSCVRGKIYNYYSDNDSILKFLYRTANAFKSNPIGLHPIESNNEKIVSINVSNIVSGHMNYKPRLRDVLK